MKKSLDLPIFFLNEIQTKEIKLEYCMAKYIKNMVQFYTKGNKAQLSGNIESSRELASKKLKKTLAACFSPAMSNGT